MKRRTMAVITLKDFGMTLIELSSTFMKFINGEITFGEFYTRFRRPDALLIQGAFLAIPLLLITAIGLVPLWATAFLIIEMIYAGILLSHAKNMIQQALYTAIWAITSFAIIVCGILIYAYIDGGGSLAF